MEATLRTKPINYCISYDASSAVSERMCRITTQLTQVGLNYSKFARVLIAETNCPVEEEDDGDGDIAYMSSNGLVDSPITRVSWVGRLSLDSEFKIMFSDRDLGDQRTLIIGSKFYVSMTDDTFAAYLLHDWITENSTHELEIDKVPQYLEQAGYLPIGLLQLMRHFLPEFGSPELRISRDPRCDCGDRFFDYLPKRTVLRVPTNLVGCWMATYFKPESEL